ncbi:MAG TPA: class IV adenylate cyclase [Sedimentisphaerales bacterium]|nr:class IV adenylate cyclase [Sedimentisphaerales bacterium]
MSTETEAKLKVESHVRLAERLGELGAEFLGEQIQTDYYFDDADRTLTAGDKCLRVRRQLMGKTEKVLLTYKGPKEKHELKRRREIEIEVQNRESVENLLSALGYEEVLVFEKRRRLWRLAECEVALDELPLLGSFVEIEGRDGEMITGVQKRLGLEHLSHVRQSYASLVADKLRRQSYG